MSIVQTNRFMEARTRGVIEVAVVTTHEQWGRQNWVGGVGRGDKVQYDFVIWSSLFFIDGEAEITDFTDSNLFRYY